MLKRILPYLVAVATFAVLTAVYFMPYYQDMTLSQGDITQWEGMSHEITEWNKSHPAILRYGPTPCSAACHLLRFL